LRKKDRGGERTRKKDKDPDRDREDRGGERTRKKDKEKGQGPR